MCAMYCPYGFQKDDKGCDICICYEPCANNPCNEGAKCVEEYPDCDGGAMCQGTYSCQSEFCDMDTYQKCLANFTSKYPEMVSGAQNTNYDMNYLNRMCRDFNVTDACVKPAIVGCSADVYVSFEAIEKSVQYVCDPQYRSILEQYGACLVGEALKEGLSVCNYTMLADIQTAGLEGMCNVLKSYAGCSLNAVSDSCGGEEIVMWYARLIDEALDGTKELLSCHFDAEDMWEKTEVPENCLLAPEVGFCRARIARHYYNQTANSCMQFYYGGCGGNENNFETQDDCEKACGIKKSCEEMPMCMMYCPYGFIGDENGCPTCHCYNPCEDNPCGDEQTCEPQMGDSGGVLVEDGTYLCKDADKRCPMGEPLSDDTIEYFCGRGPGRRQCPEGYYCNVHPTDAYAVCCTELTENTTTVAPVGLPESCTLPMVVGRCRGAIPKFYFNTETRQCEPFFYGGCGGNNNNFETLDECQDMCNMDPEPSECPEVMCLMFCEFGFKKDDKGCDMCFCVDPCEDAVCGETQECRPIDGDNYECIGGVCNVTAYQRCLSNFTDKYPEIKGQHSSQYNINFLNNMCRDFKVAETCAKPVVDGCTEDILASYGEIVDVMAYLCTEESRSIIQDYGTCLESEAVQQDIISCNATMQTDLLSAGLGEICNIIKSYAGCVLNGVSDGCDSDVVVIWYAKLIDQALEAPQKLFGCHFKAEDQWKKTEVPETCLLAPAIGRCRGRMPRYYYNQTANSCVQFYYGGCGGNENNFESQDDCEESCGIKKSCDRMPMCMMYCPYGFVGDENGCPTCHCYNPCENNPCGDEKICEPQMGESEGVRVEDGTYSCEESTEVTTTVSPVGLPESCTLPMVVGRCRGAIPTFYFNTETRQCEQFLYGGCGGNDNNFETLDECQDMCNMDPEPSECSEVMCLMFCEFGFEKDDKGCDMCFCVDPCEGVECGEMKECQPIDRDNYECVDICNSMMCAMYCEFGFTKDENGCDTCFCYNPCDNAECGERQECQAIDSMNYECVDICQPVRCRMYCAFGWDTDESGCETCQCFDPCAEVDCGERQECEGLDRDNYHCVDMCHPVHCRMYCQFGWDTDASGCEICQCYEPCNFVDCEDGYSCRAQDRENFECVYNCPPDLCELGCEYGYEKDEHGCKMCSCLDPCKDKTCGNDMQCLVTYAGCMGPDCELKAICSDGKLCQLEKQEAMVSLYVNTNGPIYVPRCEPNGLYRQIQCNDYTGLCWCVDQASGEAIPGTKTRGAPNCDDPQGDVEVCPGNTLYKLCSPLLCAKRSCAANGGRNAVCRINPCGEMCVPEFFNPMDNTLLDCDLEFTSCIVDRYAAAKYIFKNDKQMYYNMLEEWFSDMPKDRRPHMPDTMIEPTPEDMGHSMPVSEPVGPTGLPTTTNARPPPPPRTAGPGRPGPPAPIGIGPDGGFGEDIPLEAPRWRGEPARSTIEPTKEPERRRHPPVTYETAEMIRSVGVPTCTPHGSYALKQSQGDYSWCVDEDGVFVEGTMTLGDLMCNKDGRDEFNSPGSVLTCDNGVTPEPCPLACLYTTCNHPDRGLTCKADPCNLCQVTFYDSMGQEASCYEDTCSWVPRDAWYFDESASECFTNFKGDDCDGLLVYTSKLECTRQHAVNVPDKCADKCEDQTCMWDPYAVCVVDYKLCLPYFVDMRTGIQVDCQQVVGICERDKARVYYEHFKMPESPGSKMMGECDGDGNYLPTQCAMMKGQKQCWCVEKNGKMIPGSMYELEDYQTLKCDQSHPVSVKGSLKLMGNFNEIDNQLSFKMAIREQLSLAMNIPEDKLTITNVRSGSVIVEYTISFIVSDPKQDSGMMTQIDTFTMMVSEGDYTFTYGKMELTAQSNNYSLVYAEPPTNDDHDDHDDKGFGPGYIALICIIVSLVLAIFAGFVFVLFCRYREKHDKEARWKEYKRHISQQGLVSSRASTSSGEGSCLPRKESPPPSYDEENQQGFNNPSYVKQPNVVVAQENGMKAVEEIEQPVDSRA